MFFKVFLLFVVFPIVELIFLIKIGTLIGITSTILLILFTAIAGAYMVKTEGLGVMYRFKDNLSKGIFPEEEILDGVLVLVAGALLITPGVLTDFIGFLLVFPPSRGLIKVWIKRYIRKKIEKGDIHITFKGG